MFHKDFSIVFTLVFGFLTTPLFAEIVLVAPAENATVSTVSPVIRDFWSMSRRKRLRTLRNDKKFQAIRQSREAVPFVFEWKCTENEKGPFQVEVACDESMTIAPHVWVDKIADDKKQVKIANFELGRTYFWRIKGFDRNGKAVQSKTGVFISAQDPVRLIRPGGSFNMRDLGGRPGLDGRMIRQGMIFRSMGICANSPDFQRGKAVTPEEIKSMRPGRNYLTPEKQQYLAKGLGIKTDLDLREEAEAAGWTGSPIDDGVQWINVSAECYQGIFTDGGKQAMAKCFRVFCDRKNYPVDFHCMAGVDRTGSLAVVLGGALGEDQDEVLKDFEISAHDSAKGDSTRASLITGFDSYAPAGATFAQKIEGYLHSCGITDQEIAEFREIMLLPKEK